MPNSKQIVYLSQSQYAELIANGSITVNGVTVQYDENDIYVTPQAEPVTDIRVNNVSIAANGVANIPIGGINVNGVVNVSANSAGGLDIQQTVNPGRISIVSAISSNIKAGSHNARPIVPANQHEATFYGLAKAAGHDEKNSTESVGTYTPEAKGAIQQMLGVSDLIATVENNLVASKAYAIGDVFTVNGKLYKATAAIAADAAIIPAVEGEEIAGANCVETSVGEGFPHDVQVNGVSVVQNGIANVPIAIDGSYGLVKPTTTYGVNIINGYIGLRAATDTYIKEGTAVYATTLPNKQHVAAFYGLAKAAGDTTQSQSDNAVGTYTDDAKAAIRTMLGAVGTTDYASNSNYGLIKTKPSGGTSIDSVDNTLIINKASSTFVKAGASSYTPIVPYNQHESTFYGLAKASGDTTQSASSNAVGQYTDSAKASIKSMLGIQDGSTGTVNVSGTTPTITAVENTRYVCGEVTSLSFTPAASGICIVRFTSGSTVTVLTLPNTVKFPEWFDPTSLETNTIYEICVTDGVYGAVMSWAL